METHKTSIRQGLSESEVMRSRAQHGDNGLRGEKGKSFFRELLASFADPIIRVLLIALAINVIFLFQTADWFETLGIAAAILIATFVSTLSERGSEAAFRRLQEEASQIRCRVRRGGKTVTVALPEIVVGDLVLLQPGEKVPADGVLTEGSLSVDQSALNGESKEKQKKASSALSAAESLMDESSLFRGSVVCSGEGVLLVTAVGEKTFYGSMAHELQTETRESPLKIRLGNLASVISRLGYFGAFVVAAAYLLNTFVIDTGANTAVMLERITNLPFLLTHLMNAVTMAVTIVVVAVPEGLPMMITVVLSSNMKKMLRDHVLVRKMVGIETAGSLNLLFTDKTGTLTCGTLTATCFVSGDGSEYESIRALKQDRGLYELFALSARYNTAAEVSEGQAMGGNATDRALLNSILPLRAELEEVRVLSFVPFDSKIKFSAVQLAGARRLTLVKGAPEKILPALTEYYDADGKKRPLSDQSCLRRKWTQMTKSAMRVLAVAVCEISVSADAPFPPLTLIGLVGIKDEIRPEAREAVLSVRGAGVQTVMITGDNAETGAAIARECGIILPEEKGVVLSGSELAEMSDGEVKSILKDLRVVARALPTDKSRLVRLAQEEGLVCGMTGDGVNDAPALKTADVGFAMGGGTEVAKEAGDIVILDNNFSSIAKAVLYGRTIFKSIRKFIIFQLTMNLCAVGVSVIGPLIGIDAPITVMQMLWVNIIMDTLGGLAFAGEAPQPEYMREKPKRRDEPIVNGYMLNQIFCLGIFTLALFVLFLKSPHCQSLFRYAENPVYFMTAFFALFIFAGILNCFSVRTHRLNLLAHLGENRAFVLIMAAIAAVQTIFIYFGGTLFRTLPLQPKELLCVVLIAALVLPADLLRKIMLRIAGKKGGV